jgi:hypothetical protein
VSRRHVPLRPALPLPYGREQFRQEEGIEHRQRTGRQDDRSVGLSAGVSVEEVIRRTLQRPREATDLAAKSR